MLTAGVDLATEPQRTAMAVIEWSGPDAHLGSVVLDVDDGSILDVAARVEKLGLDCPLGWPDLFLKFVQDHHSGHVVAPQDVAGRDWRRLLAYRATDRFVRNRTGITPLSVAADRIGLTAMRAAGLLAQLAASGRPVDRAGTGVVVEVYPAASLKCWNLAYRGYKGGGNGAHLRALVEDLQASAPWLNLGSYTSLCAASDHALDAVVAALTARASALCLVTEPADDDREQAGREGWIALPTGALEDLAPRAS